MTGAETEITSLSFYPDGSKIVSGNSDSTLRIWDVKTGKQIVEYLLGHSERVNCVVVYNYPRMEPKSYQQVMTKHSGFGMLELENKLGNP